MRFDTTLWLIIWFHASLVRFPRCPRFSQRLRTSASSFAFRVPPALPLFSFVPPLASLTLCVFGSFCVFSCASRVSRFPSFHPFPPSPREPWRPSFFPSLSVPASASLSLPVLPRAFPCVLSFFNGLLSSSHPFPSFIASGGSRVAFLSAPGRFLDHFPPKFGERSWIVSR